MTSPEQLPPAYDLPAGARRRMRERLLAEIAGAGATGRSRHRAWLAPAAVAASVLLAAGAFTTIRTIAGSQAPAPGGTVGPTGSTGASTTPAPTATGTGDGLDCGTFTLAQGEQMPESAVQCLIDAAATGKRARLQETKPTVEGDPIVMTYLLDGQGRIQIVIDSRADSFGSGEVRRENCTQLTQVNGRLVLDGCTESTAGSN